MTHAHTAKNWILSGNTAGDIMAIAYHGSAALFSRFDPMHLLEGDGKFKFGVGAYLTSSYATAAHYSGVSGGPDKYVYTVEIPDMTE